MKTFLVVSLAFGMMGCSMLGLGTKKAPELVSSCFSEGDNQELYCKSQRTTEDGRVAITRCIGAKNQETLQTLRGKCAEKICSVGSQTDCQVRGEHLVLEKYAELATAKLFNADDAGPDTKGKLVPKDNKHKAKSKMLPLEVTPAPASVTSSQTTVKVAPPKAVPPKEEMTIALTPIKKSRTPASAAGGAAEGVFKKVCISKTETSAPQNLRGKCATRTCTAGKCTYQGQKEMFDWTTK